MKTIIALIFAASSALGQTLRERIDVAAPGDTIGSKPEFMRDLWLLRNR